MTNFTKKQTEKEIFNPIKSFAKKFGLDVHVVKNSGYTKKQIDNRTSDYVCFDCGKPFLTDKQLEHESVVTVSVTPCGLCGEEKSTTHIRHFNYLRIK